MTPLVERSSYYSSLETSVQIPTPPPTPKKTQVWLHAFVIPVMEGEEAGGSLELAGYQPSCRPSKKHCLEGKGWRITEEETHRLPLSSTHTFKCEHPPTHAPVFHTTYFTYPHTVTLVIITWCQRTTVRLKGWNKCVYKPKIPAKY